MDPNSYQKRMLEAAKVQAESIARLEAKADQQTESLAVLIARLEALIETPVARKAGKP